MFYDLNLPWAAKDQELPRTVAFLADRESRLPERSG